MDLFPRTDIIGGLVSHNGHVGNHTKDIELGISCHAETVVLMSRAKE